MAKVRIIKIEKDKMIGKVKEEIGKKIGNEDLEMKGKLQRIKGEANESIETIKDKIKTKANDLIDKISKD